MGKGFEGERKMRNTKEGDEEESDEKRLRVRDKTRAGAVGRGWERCSEGVLWRGKRWGGRGREEGREAGREKARDPKYLKGGGVTGR